ncbi:hypothetical protein RFW15_13985, partial [Enterococcus faecalis]|uniref:hypothetical protein n=1 Tax=Enterococcus faecalis TaxID=1351 RepID=UPI002814663E|nr:hypothetical protein [Enterococcus faecalis]
TDSLIPNSSISDSEEDDTVVRVNEKDSSSVQKETLETSKSTENSEKNIDNGNESGGSDESNVLSIEAITSESSNDNQSKEKNITNESNDTSVQKLASVKNAIPTVYGWSYKDIAFMNYRFLAEYNGDPEHIKIPSRIGGYNVLIDLSDGLSRYGIDKTKVKSITFVDEGGSGIASIVKQLADVISVDNGHDTYNSDVYPKKGNKIDFSGFTNLESVDFSGFSFSSPDDPYDATQGYWDFREMFAGDTKLKSVNFNSKHAHPSSWTEVLRMRNMFKDCVSLEKIDLSFLVGDSRIKTDFETGTFSNTPSLKEINFNGDGSSLNFSKSALFNTTGTIFDTTNTKRKNLKLLVPKGNEITGISNEEWARYGVDPIGAGITLNTTAGNFSNGQMTKSYMYNVVNPSSSDLPVEASFEQPTNLEEGKVFFGWNKTGSQNSFGLTFSTYSANIVESEWTWTKNSDNTVTLNSYIGKSTDIVVPNEVAGMPTQINLASGIDARGLGDKDWTKATSITFSNANGKKVKLLGNRIKFDSWTSLTSFDGRGLDVTGVKDLSYLFHNSSA